MEATKLAHVLVERLGEPYSKLLGINLYSGASNEKFKWFLASVLFGARISESIAIKTYREFQKRKVVSPERILETGWDGLVKILDEGGYVRYDFKTATKLLEIAKNLTREYQGNLNILHSEAKDAKDLERRLMKLGKGVGQVTAAILLRDLRGIWKKADSPPTSSTIEAARNLGLTKGESDEEALENLKSLWSKSKMKGKDFLNFETALLRLGKDWCRKKKCQECSFVSCCSKKQ